MRLCADIGNSALKLGIFDSNGMVDYIRVSKNEIENIPPFLDNYTLEKVLISSVRRDISFFTDLFEDSVKLEVLSYTTPSSMQLEYDTPETLGVDRIAAALGAKSLFENENCIIIDIGTCMTLDFLSDKGLFQGGNISPGMRMRLLAMHEMTSKLPLVPDQYHAELLGKNTDMALQNGAFYGILFEIKGFIEEITKKYANVKVILTGGAANDFVELIGSEIFVHPFLILEGLNYIYD